MSQPHVRALTSFMSRHSFALALEACCAQDNPILLRKLLCYQGATKDQMAAAVHQVFKSSAVRVLGELMTILRDNDLIESIDTWADVDPPICFAYDCLPRMLVAWLAFRPQDVVKEDAEHWPLLHVVCHNVFVRQSILTSGQVDEWH